MAKDVIITPSDGDIQFENSTGTEAGKIEQSGDDLVLSNAVGDILIGDGTTDVYIGDGAANVDIVFEQNGSIRGEDGSSVDITLGSSDTDVIISGSTFNIDPDATFSGTIDAGAITSTGKITGTELEGTSLDINGNADISGNLNVGSYVHWDLSAGEYSGDPRAVTMGYSGGNYGQFGYNIEFTTTSGTHNRVFNDIPTRVDLHRGIRVFTSTAGAGGTSITWTDVFRAQDNAFQYKGNNIYYVGNDSDILNSNVTDYVSAANGGTFSAGITISSTVPSLDFVDTNSFTDTADRFRVRAGANQGLFQWKDDSEGTTQTIMSLDPNGDVDIVGDLTADNFSGTSSGTNTGDQDLSGFYTETEIIAQNTTLNETLAHLRGWVPGYNNSDDTSVRWNRTEDALELQSDSDTSTGAVYQARRIENGETVRFTIMVKGSAAASNGLYLRLYQHDGNLPDGKTHVSNDATGTYVQEDDRGDSGWYENSAITTSWVTFEREYTAPADGYISLVVLNWSGIGTNSVYLKTPDIQTTKPATVASIGDLTGHITSTNRATTLGSFTLAELNTAISDNGVLPIDGGTLTGNLQIPEYLYHAGDSNTYLRFRGDDLQLVAGGRNIMRMDEGTDPDKVEIGDASTVAYTLGSVGIGTTTPTNTDVGTLAPKLHVQQSDTSGEFNLVARFQAGSDANDTGGAILINHSNDRGLLIEGGRGGAGTIPDDDAVSHLGLVQSNGTNTRVITLRQKSASNGSLYGVGIGTETPDVKLHLAHSDSNNGLLLQHTSQASGFQILQNIRQTEGLIWQKWTSGAYTANLMTLDYDGKLGIGTTDPQQKLHIEGNIYLGPNNTNNFVHSGANLGLQADGEVKIVSDVNDTADAGGSDIIFGYGSSTNTDSNQDFTEAELSTYPRVEIMRIDASTNSVGIGTTTANQKLHVVGNVEIEGSIYTNQYIYHNDDTNTYIRFLADETRLIAGGVDFIRLKEDGTQDYMVINEDGNDTDFRVEGDAETHLIFTQASNDRVGIGASNPQQRLHIDGGNIAIGLGDEVYGMIAPGTQTQGLSFIVGDGIDENDTPLMVLNGESSTVSMYASGSTVLDIQGSQGQLFSITDDLSGDLFSVSDISGVPIFNVNASGTSTFDGNVQLGDNNKVQLGDSQDLEIYHDGTDSLLVDNGTGALKIFANGNPRFQVGSDVHVLSGTDFAIAAGRKFYLDGQSDTYIIESSSNAIKFFTGGTEVLLLGNNDATFQGNTTVNGKVAIGIASATHQLHVHTNTDNAYAIRIEGSTNNGSGVWTGLGIGGEVNNTKSAVLFEDIGVSYSRGKLHLCVNNDANQNSATPADAKLTVKNDGYIGIGTTNPLYKLEVNAGNGIFVGDGGVPVLEANSSTGEFKLGDTDELGDGVYITNNSTAEFDIYSAGSLKFRMNSNGQVGIGTSTVSYRLHVDNDALNTNSAALYVRNPNSSTSAVIAEFKGDSDSIQIKNIGAGDYAIYNTQQSNGIALYDGTGGVEIKYNGATTLESDSTGGIKVTGTLSATGDVIAYSSDKRLKDNIKPIENAVDKIKQLKGVTFDWNEKSEKLGFEPTTKINDVGVIAQDVEAVLPQLVQLAPFDIGSDEDGNATSKSGEEYKTVNYARLTAVLIEAVKEQQKQIDELKDLVMNLKDNK